MKISLVGHLRDPSSGESFALENAKPRGESEVISGRLRTPSGVEYPIVDGVPDLVLRDRFTEGQRETVESFSWKWRRAKNYASATAGHYVGWYLQRYGFGTEEGLATFLAGKESILDAGTAHGRDACLYERNSQAMVFGLDISEGIRNAYRDLWERARLHLVQADIMQIPFPPDFFDFIGCDQVIHHTPEPREALRSLLRHLVPGGHIAFYVYKRKGPVREFCDDHIRAQTVEMSPGECLEVSEAITRFGQSLSEMRVTIEVPEDIPILGIKKGKHDLQRFIYWNVFKCYWNEALDWDSNVITNFDWYHPRHAHRYDPTEVRAWCDEEGLEIERFDVQESGTSVLARLAG
ncbi:MAG: class I SAM-dependent methyltransferase [Myxococcota bacterium]